MRTPSKHRNLTAWRYSIRSLLVLMAVIAVVCFVAPRFFRLSDPAQYLTVFAVYGGLELLFYGHYFLIVRPRRKESEESA